MTSLREIVRRVEGLGYTASPTVVGEEPGDASEGLAREAADLRARLVAA